MTPNALRGDAIRAIRTGQIDQGIAAYVALLAVAPDGPDDWYNLGYLLRCAGRFDEAIAAYDAALARGIAEPEAVHVNRAIILGDHLGDAAGAEAALRAALAIAPDFVVAMMNLANLYEERGERAAARSLYETVTAREPGNGRAIARMAVLDMQAGSVAPVVPRLQAVLADPRLALDDRGEIGFALGDALDSLARYDDAFAAYRDANIASRRAAEGSVAAYDPAAHERLIDRIIAAFPQAVPVSAPTDGAPIFVCGMFRSGSTLAEQILGRHSMVQAGGELELLPALVASRLQPYPQAAADLLAEQVAALRVQYRAGVERIHPSARIVTDKRPDNFLHIGLIRMLFPEARIVHTTRGALDNCLSVYFLNFAPSISYGFDLASIGHFYAHYRRLMAHWTRLYPDIHAVNYDALVAAPEPTVRALLGALDLPWEPQCLSATPAETVVRTASNWQVRQPIHTRSSGRWRNYDRHLAPLRAALGIP